MRAATSSCCRSRSRNALVNDVPVDVGVGCCCETNGLVTCHARTVGSLDEAIHEEVLERYEQGTHSGANFDRSWFILSTQRSGWDLHQYPLGAVPEFVIPPALHEADFEQTIKFEL